MSDLEFNKWHTFEGKECPVPPQYMVTVHTEFEGELAEVMAQHLDWGNSQIRSFKILAKDEETLFKDGFWHKHIRNSAPLNARAFVEIMRKNSEVQRGFSCDFDWVWRNNATDIKFFRFIMEVQDKDWKLHLTKKCPVKKNTEVVVMLKDGTIINGPANLFVWDVLDDNRSIKCYAVSEVR